jgi:hypothetical protein
MGNAIVTSATPGSYVRPVLGIFMRRVKMVRMTNCAVSLVTSLVTEGVRVLVQKVAHPVRKAGKLMRSTVV